MRLLVNHMQGKIYLNIIRDKRELRYKRELRFSEPHISSFKVQNYTKPLLNNISNCHYKPSIQMRYMIANVFRYKNT